MVHFWDERYGAESFYYGTEPNDFLKENAKRIPPQGRVLCLAEGEGRNAVFLASLGFQVTAVDGSAVGLKKLKELAEARGVCVETQVSDLADYVIQPESWDAVVSIWCHLPEKLRKQVHAQAVRGLKKNGVWLSEAYHPRQLHYKTGGPSSADLMVTSEILKKELGELKFEILREMDREIQEGQGHSGISAVVQCVGVKSH